jgi:NADP-dependent 3-hydroxy acid dehydrogenase YdfG
VTETDRAEPAPAAPETPVAVVTGASSGIGAATARRLIGEGFQVVAAARRADRLAALSAELGAAFTAVTCDITYDADVARLAEAVRGRAAPVTVLVNNAGGAFGADPVETADVAQWQAMYETNVLGSLRVTKAMLPLLEASGAGSIVMISSTAGLVVYEGGGGYTAAKHAQTAMAETLRLELCERPIRVIEIDPGMVRTDGFALNRFAGTRGGRPPCTPAWPALVAEDIADCVAWVATRPHHVNIDRLVVRPLAQAAQHKVHRT